MMSGDTMRRRSETDRGGLDSKHSQSRTKPEFDENLSICERVEIMMFRQLYVQFFC